MTYTQAQAIVREHHGIKDTASTLLDKWENLVLECESGYSWDYSEFLNELRVRDEIETILSVPELHRYKEHGVLRERVASIDQRLRVLFHSEKESSTEGPWWRRGILKRAGADYAEYCWSAFSVPVEVVA